MTRTQAREQIVQFYNRRQQQREFNEAKLEPAEPEGLDDGFRLNATERPVATRGERRLEPAVADWIGWAICGLVMFLVGMGIVAVARWMVVVWGWA